MQEPDIHTLIEWYRLNRRDLPWRTIPTPYRIWISEIMLQQTQVRTVLPYYERFVARFPDVRSLGEAPEAEVLHLWAGLGYYGRARNLRRAAQKILAEHGGELPSTPEELLGLPGIGRYTAGAILSIAFNRAHPAVDGNVKRVIARVWGLRSPRPERFFRDLAAAWIPREQPSDFNQALMELGALVCVPVRPKCEICPMQSRCVARRRGIQDRIPPSRKTRAIEVVRLVVLVVTRGRSLLICRQPPGSFVPGPWGLPFRALSDGESADELACRLARELLGRPVPLRPASRVTHSIVHRRITAHVYRAEIDRPRVRARMVPASSASNHLTSSLFRKAIRATDSGPAE